MLVGMARKRWTREMRQRAAEHGRRGGAAGDRAGKRRGGLVAWHGKTPEQQAAVLEAFRTHTGRQANATPRARRAQAERARAQGKARTSMTAAQAAFLADAGMLGKAPLPPSLVPGHVPLVLPPPPKRADYPDEGAWLAAMREWARQARA